MIANKVLLPEGAPCGFRNSNIVKDIICNRISIMQSYLNTDHREKPHFR